MLLDIVGRINGVRSQAPELNKVMTSLLRFHFVERILPQRKSILNRYYEQLKLKCTWLMKSPHYWVQYAMCRLAFSDYRKAQDYLDTAYEQARNKSLNYHTDNIDTQQARLFLNQCADNANSSESFKYFSDAHKLLVSLPNDGRKFRQLYYTKMYSKENILITLVSIKFILNMLQKHY